MLVDQKKEMKKKKDTTNI